MTERETFMARLDQERKEGLKDLKFFFMPSRAFSPDEIFAALNQIDNAIANGNCVQHTGWTDNQPRP